MEPEVCGEVEGIEACGTEAGATGGEAGGAGGIKDARWLIGAVDPSPTASLFSINLTC